MEMSVVSLSFLVIKITYLVRFSAVLSLNCCVFKVYLLL